MSSKLTHRIPFLYGIRGLSILMVLFGHAFRNYFHHIDIANLGVRIYFYLLEKPSLNFRNILLLKYKI